MALRLAVNILYSVQKLYDTTLVFTITPQFFTDLDHFFRNSRYPSIFSKNRNYFFFNFTKSEKSEAKQNYPVNVNKKRRFTHLSKLDAKKEMPHCELGKRNPFEILNHTFGEMCRKKVNLLFPAF